MSIPTTVSDAEYTFCMYKLKLEGSFITHLIETIFRADTQNREKLKKAFPELVEVCNKYNYENQYWPDLVERWNSIHSHEKGRFFKLEV